MGFIAAADAASKSSGSSLTFPILIVLVFVGFYFLMIRPQRRRQQRVQQQQRTVEPGARVRTTAGMYATVTEVDGDDVVLEVIIRRSAGLLGVTLTDEGAAELSTRSRGTPRIANRLLRRVRDYAEVRADGVVTRDVARAALELYEVDDYGLDRLDRAVLTAVVRRFGGGPVGLSTLAVAVGEEAETVEVVVEPFLVRLGLLARTPRGRVATPAAWERLGLAVPAATAATELPGSATLFG